MKNCKDITRLFSERMERPLSTSERIHLKLHCMMCTGCKNFGDHMLDIRLMARQFAKGSDPVKPGQKKQ
jgi:hypothetical protein